MAVSRFSTSQVGLGLPKYQKFWDGVAALQIKGGFLHGGYNGSAKVSTINKLVFSTDSYSTLSATAPAGIYGGAGSANSGVAGYTYAGEESAFTNRIAKLNFSSEAISTLSATTTTSVLGAASFSDDGTAGYKASGFTGGGFIGETDKLTYSNETRSTTGSTMFAGYYLQGISNKGVAGYTVGGYSWSTNFISTVYKLTFSNGAVSTPTNYIAAQYNIGTWENNGTAGYAIGGGESFLSTLCKMPFSTDTLSSTSTSLSSGTDWGAGLAEKDVAGYYCLGRINRTATDKFAFSNDARTTITPTLTSRYGISYYSNTGII